MIGIYKIENCINGKVYIGKSVDIMNRWKEHIEQGINALQYEDKFHFDLNEHPDHFIFTILEICKESELSDKENFYIKKYNSIKNGYNKISASNEINLDREFARSEQDIIKKLNTIIGKPLFVEDKKKLANFFNYKNKKGEVCGWKTLKKHLIENNFIIVETKRKFNGKMRNCSIISVKYEY